MSKGIFSTVQISSRLANQLINLPGGWQRLPAGLRGQAARGVSAPSCGHAGNYNYWKNKTGSSCVSASTGKCSCLVSSTPQKQDRPPFPPQSSAFRSSLGQECFRLVILTLFQEKVNFLLAPHEENRSFDFSQTVPHLAASSNSISEVRKPCRHIGLQHSKPLSCEAWPGWYCRRPPHPQSPKTNTHQSGGSSTI